MATEMNFFNYPPNKIGWLRRLFIKIVGKRYIVEDMNCTMEFYYWRGIYYVTDFHFWA